MFLRCYEVVGEALLLIPGLDCSQFLYWCVVCEQFSAVLIAATAWIRRRRWTGPRRRLFRPRAARGRFKVGPADDGALLDVMCVCGGRGGAARHWRRHGPRPLAGRAWLFAPTDRGDISLCCVHHGDVGAGAGLDHGPRDRRCMNHIVAVHPTH